MTRFHRDQKRRDVFLLTQRRTGGVRDAVANRNESFPPWRGHPASPVRPGCAVGPSGACIRRPRESPLPHRHLRPLTRPPKLLLTRAGHRGPSPLLRKACVSEPLRNFTKLLGSDSVVWSGLLGSSLKTSPGGAHIGGGNYCPE